VVFEGGKFNDVNDIYHRPAFVVTLTKIWDSTSNNELIVICMVYGKMMVHIPCSKTKI